MKTYLVALAALAVAGPATAQNQAELNIRAHRDRARAETGLNAQYRLTMAAMKQRDARHAPDAGPGPSYQNALLGAQRAWLAYRDAQCLVEGYAFRGGSARPLAVDTCYADLTNARTATLKDEMWQK